MKKEAIEKIDPQFADLDFLSQQISKVVKKDPILWAILFGTRLDREPKPEALVGQLANNGVIGVMRRAISLAYLIALSTWKEIDSIKNENNAFGSQEKINTFNKARFSRLFRGAIVNEEVGVDLEVFSLIELWIYLKNRDDLLDFYYHSFFLVGPFGDDIVTTFQEASKAIKNADFKRTDQNDEETTLVNNKVCYDLLRNLLIFKKLTIEFDNSGIFDINNKEDFVIKFELQDYDELVLYPNRYLNNAKIVMTAEQVANYSDPNKVKTTEKLLNLFILSEISTFNKKLETTYASFDDEKTIMIRKENIETELEEDHDEESTKEVRKFLAFNYGHLRDLSVAISDSIRDDPDTKQVILDICQDRFSMIISGLPKKTNNSRYTINDVDEIYWDNIVTLMIVEMGQSDFLEEIINERNYDLYSKIMDNLEKRLSNKGEVRERRAICQRREARLNETEYDKLKKKQYRIEAIIKSVGKREEKEVVDEEDYFGESLTSKYSRIIEYIGVLKQFRDTPDNVNMRQCDDAWNKLTNLFKGIFTFLLVFYELLDYYALDKERNENSALTYSDEDVSNTGVDTRFTARRQLIENCKSQAKDKLKEIGDLNLVESFDKFCDLCDDYMRGSFDKSNAGSFDAKSKRLKKLITRSYICDSSKLRFFANTSFPKESRFWKDPNVPETYSILEILQNKPSGVTSNPSFVNWLNHLKDLFLFLIYNEDYNEQGLYAKRTKDGETVAFKDKDCDPIYPYIVTYYNEQIDRDNFKKCSYRVPIPMNGDMPTEKDSVKTVTLLMEENYRPSTYFCVPLRYGSSESWWINPFLFPVAPLQDAYREHRLMEKNKKEE